MEFCNSFNALYFFNLYVRRFFFGLVYFHVTFFSVNGFHLSLEGGRGPGALNIETDRNVI